MGCGKNSEFIKLVAQCCEECITVIDVNNITSLEKRFKVIQDICNKHGISEMTSPLQSLIVLARNETNEWSQEILHK
jgi:hypothetical protein